MVFEEPTAGHAPRLVGGLLEREREVGVDVAFVRLGRSSAAMSGVEWIVPARCPGRAPATPGIRRDRRDRESLHRGRATRSTPGGRTGFRSGRIGMSHIACRAVGAAGLARWRTRAVAWDRLADRGSFRTAKGRRGRRRRSCRHPVATLGRSDALQRRVERRTETRRQAIGEPIRLLDRRTRFVVLSGGSPRTGRRCRRRRPLRRCVSRSAPRATRRSRAAARCRPPRRCGRRPTCRSTR